MIIYYKKRMLNRLLPFLKTVGVQSVYWVSITDCYFISIIGMIITMKDLSSLSFHYSREFLYLSISHRVLLHYSKWPCYYPITSCGLLFIKKRKQLLDDTQTFLSYLQCSLLNLAFLTGHIRITTQSWR